MAAWLGWAAADLGLYWAVFIGATDTDREPPPMLSGVQPGKLRQVRLKEYLIRFALGAAVSIWPGS